MNTDRLAKLTEVLLDADAEFGDRDDAAIALASFDEKAAEEALLGVVSDASADPQLADRCGESLAEIWTNRGRVDPRTVGRLTGVGRRVALLTLRTLSPALAEELQKEGVEFPHD